MSDIETNLEGKPSCISGTETHDTGYFHEEANLVDVAFLIDGSSQQKGILDVLKHKLHLTRELVRETHPDVIVRVAFISYCQYPVVADLKAPLDNEIFREAISVIQLRGSDERSAQDILDSLLEVPTVGWSAPYRLLVSIADSRNPTEHDHQDEKEVLEDGDDARSSGSRLKLLQRLLSECRLQRFYFGYFDSSTRSLCEDLKRFSLEAGAEADWLVSEQLEYPEALPYRLAELILGLLDAPQSCRSSMPAETTKATFLAFKATGSGEPGTTPSSRSESAAGQRLPAFAINRNSNLIGQHLDERWLQHQISWALGPEVEGTRLQTLTDSVLAVLRSPGDERTVENELMFQLGLGFDLIKELVRNRSKIVKCSNQPRAELVQDPSTRDKNPRSTRTLSKLGTQSCPAIECSPAVITTLSSSSIESPQAIHRYCTSFEGSAGMGPPESPQSRANPAEYSLPPLANLLTSRPGHTAAAGSNHSSKGGSSIKNITIVTPDADLVGASSGGGGTARSPFLLLDEGSACRAKLRSPSSSSQAATDVSGSWNSAASGTCHAASSFAARADESSSAPHPYGEGSSMASSPLGSAGASFRKAGAKMQHASTETATVPLTVTTTTNPTGLSPMSVRACGAAMSSLSGGGANVGNAQLTGDPDSATTVHLPSSGISINQPPLSATIGYRPSLHPNTEAEYYVRHTGQSSRPSSGLRVSISPLEQPDRLHVAGPPSPQPAASGTPRDIYVNTINQLSATEMVNLATPGRNDSSSHSGRGSRQAESAAAEASSPSSSRLGGPSSPMGFNPHKDTPSVTLLLPWSARALEDFKSELRSTSFCLMDPADNPLTARMDSVFALPPELWPVIPPGALYCLEAAFDPRVTFQYLQHRDFPNTKVRVNTYFGKWGRHLVDFVVSWQPIPRAEAAWQPADGKQPPLPWEQRQVVAHTTQGEYQYANTRMRFRGPKSTQPDAEIVEWGDAHGVDLMDTKAANQTAPRNSDMDRDAHLVDPPRPNTWGELARRPLISNLRNQGGGAYIHHVNYDNLTLRTTCGRRVPAGYFFTLVPRASVKIPAVPGGNYIRTSQQAMSLRPSSAGRIFAGHRQSHSWTPTYQAAAAASTVHGTISGDDSGSLASRTPPLTPRTPSPARAGWSSTGPLLSPKQAAAPPQRVASPHIVRPEVLKLTFKDRWRTYDVPFNHPIHDSRAPVLGTDEARASGRGVRTFSDSTAVLKVAEQELRLPHAFVPGPVVVRKWDDIPRLYAEHMEAARAMMPVTELDNYGSSKLHVLIYHLQCAATLEYDKLDAKLLLLPQMARLGRKSPEVDAWLQATIEHASYLYDKLRIYDTSEWTAGIKPLMRSSLTLVSTSMPPSPLAPTPSAGTTTRSPGNTSAGSSRGGGWVFPDPLKGTPHASSSALNTAAQPRPSVRSQFVPVHRVTPSEWAGVASIMDTCRHAALYDTWIRLRPLMTGAEPASSPGGSSGVRRSLSRTASSAFGFPSDAAATASGDGWSAGPAAPEDMYIYGTLNREVLEHLHQDLQTMSSPDFVPPSANAVKKLKVRGYRGNGPLPPELAAEMPIIHRPVRCRGADDTPLPPELQRLDIWNLRNKAEQAPSGQPHPQDFGAVRLSQVALHRLQAAREFASTQQAAVRKSMQLAKGALPSEVPYYGSDVAEDDLPTHPSDRAAIATQTPQTPLDHPSPEEVARRIREEREAAAAAERHRQLLIANVSKRNRQEILEEAVCSAEAAIQSLLSRPVVTGISTPLVEPDNPILLHSSEPPEYATYVVPPPRILHANMDPKSDPWLQHVSSRTDDITDRRSRARSVAMTTDRGPEPFGLERLLRGANNKGGDESEVGSTMDGISLIDPPPIHKSMFGVMTEFSGLAEFEVAMARQRAIAGAEMLHGLRPKFIPPGDVFNLLVIYCNLDGLPDQVQLLQSAIRAPLSKRTVEAVATATAAATAANSPTAAAAATAAAVATARRANMEAETVQQRIKTTAWLLGVTLRHISNETYTSFLYRVLGWPAEIAASINRTRASNYIARALVNGHDMKTVPKISH